LGGTYSRSIYVTKIDTIQSAYEKRKK
jgi:hypothetical protein